MQLTKWLHEPLWRSKVKVIHWPWSKVTQIHLFKLLFLRNHQVDLSQISCGTSMGWKNESLFKWSRSHDQYGRHAHIWKNLKKIFFSGTKQPMTLKVGMQHRVLKYYQICSNDDPGLTLTYFTARSNLVPYAFLWEKGNIMDFSETIVVYDIKVGRVI